MLPIIYVLAEVIQYDDVKISVQQRELTSSYAQGNQWYFNDQAIPGAVGRSIKATRAGIYKVIVEINGCFPSDQIYLPNTVMKHEGAGVLTVYPNPANSSVSVTLANQEDQVVLLNLMDITGRSMILKEVPASLDGVYILNLEQLPAGFYILQVRAGNFAQTVKLQKE